MDFTHWFLLLWMVLIFAVLGEIWLVQIVVYPLFGKVGEAEYVAYHRFYSGRIPLPAIVPGFASFLLTIPLVFLAPDSVPPWMTLANLACGVVGLLVTVGLEIPRHARLENGGKQVKVIRELVRYNWPRTASITGSAFLTLLSPSGPSPRRTWTGFTASPTRPTCGVTYGTPKWRSGTPSPTARTRPPRPASGSSA